MNMVDEKINHHMGTESCDVQRCNFICSKRTISKLGCVGRWVLLNG